MRRLAQPVITYARHFTASIARAWDDFWYTPADPMLLGVLRILTGSMLVYTHFVWGLALDDFIGPSGWVGASALRTLQAQDYVVSYWWSVPHEHYQSAHLAGLTILVLFTLGIATRVTSVLSFLVTVSYVQRAAPALFGLDQINSMLTLYLALGPCGQALSIDRLVGRWFRSLRLRELPDDVRTRALAAVPSVGANVSLRLIQIHMCVIYFFAGISKLQGPAWWNGEAMWLAFSSREYQTMDMTWLAHYPLMIDVMTHFTVLWEIAFCVLIWKPLWRPLVLFGAVVLHVGIGLCMGMWTFGLIMLVGCASFLSSTALRQQFDRVLAPRSSHTAARSSSSIAAPREHVHASTT